MSGQDVVWFDFPDRGDGDHDRVRRLDDAADAGPWPRKMPTTTISRRLRPPVMLRSISTTSVAIELDQPLVADPEVMRDLVEHDVSDLAA